MDKDDIHNVSIFAFLSNLHLYYFETVMLQEHVYIRTVVFGAPMNDTTHAVRLLILPYLNQLLFDIHFDETRGSANNEVKKKSDVHKAVHRDIFLW